MIRLRIWFYKGLVKLFSGAELPRTDCGLSGNRTFTRRWRKPASPRQFPPDESPLRYRERGADFFD